MRYLRMVHIPRPGSLDGTDQETESDHESDREVTDNKDDQAESDRTEDAEDYGSQANGNNKQ